MKKHSEKFLKKRKFLMALPVLIIPFLTMAFSAAGGGKGKGKSEHIVLKQGLNTNLPDPKLKDDKSLDKLSFYELAQKDSQRLKIAMNNDRYSLQLHNDSNKYSISNLKNIANSYSEKYHQPGIADTDQLKLSSGNTDKSKVAEETLMKKLHQLETEINKPVNENTKYKSSERAVRHVNENFGSDVDRLENMVNVIKNKGGDDPEMKRLDSMLEKIIDIQNPERVKEKMKEKNRLEKKSVMPVMPHNDSPVIKTMGNDGSESSNTTNAFFGLSGESSSNTGVYNAIEAVVHETETLVSGSVVKLRLLTDININGTVIPKDNFLFGIAQLNGERLKIEINNIAYNNSIYPVNLEVFDLDGLAGIHVPGAISRDVAKQSANSSVQSMSFSTLDPSLAAQATTAGINAAKDLFSKKVKLIKVTVKAGYKVLLYINKN